MIRSASLLLLFVLTACGQSSDSDGVGGVSAGEARALNDAAAMLDARASANIQTLDVPEASNAAH